MHIAFMVICKISYSYLKMQYVVINDTQSERRQVTCVLLQGSIIGPLLFILYVNDLHKSLSKSFSILFADDTIFMINNKHKAVINNLNIELSYLNMWLKANKLHLNIAKTHYIFFLH